MLHPGARAAQQLCQRMSSSITDQVAKPGLPVDPAVGQDLLQSVGQSAVAFHADALTEENGITGYRQTHQIQCRAGQPYIRLGCTLAKQVDAFGMGQQIQRELRCDAVDGDFAARQGIKPLQCKRVLSQDAVQAFFSQGQQTGTDHSCYHTTPSTQGLMPVCSATTPPVMFW